MAAQAGPRWITPAAACPALLVAAGAPEGLVAARSTAAAPAPALDASRPAAAPEPAAADVEAAPAPEPAADTPAPIKAPEPQDVSVAPAPAPAPSKEPDAAPPAPEPGSDAAAPEGAAPAGAAPDADAPAPAPSAGLPGVLAQYAEVRQLQGWRGRSRNTLRSWETSCDRSTLHLFRPSSRLPPLPPQALALSWRFYYAQRSGKLSEAEANPVPWRGDSHLDDPVVGG